MNPLPYLNRSPAALPAVAMGRTRLRFPIMGDAVEGFELLLPEPIEVVQSSLVQVDVSVLIDNRVVELEQAVARFRSATEYAHWAASR